MSKLIILIQFCVLLICCIANINCDCTLKIPQKRENVPTYMKLFGTRAINIPSNVESIILQENENITGHCATTFNDFNYIYTESVYNHRRYASETVRSEKILKKQLSVDLYCQSSKLHYKDGHELAVNLLSCADLKWHMHESAIDFPWCESHVGSYLLATNLDNRERILAGVCFNVERIMMRSLYFSMAKKQLEEGNHKFQISTPTQLQEMPAATEINNYDGIFPNLNDTRYNPNSNWLQLANFQYHSLVPISLHGDYFQPYGTLLKAIWWPALLHGNWQRFTEAFVKHSANESYDIVMGTSGALYAPAEISTCNKSESLHMEIGNRNTTIPIYIWQYLINHNESEEFVVIGYNAPFFEFFPNKEIVFCNDICDQITWLKDTYSTFRYSALGVVFCCRASEVRTHLDGFPNSMKLEVISTVPTFTDDTTEGLNFDTEDEDW